MRILDAVLVLSVLLLGCSSDLGEEVQGTVAPIVDGEVVVDAATVALVRVSAGGDPTRELPTCSGVLVGADAVITVAQCADPLFAPTHVVFGGVGPPGAVRTIAGWSSHPEFDGARGGFANDIAVAHLDAPVEIAPVRLPSAPLDIVPGMDVDLLGFGRTEAASGTIPVATRGRARVAAASSATFEVEAGGPQPCRGDSGGPAFVTDPSGERVLAGLHSHGDPSCRAGAVEIRVDAHLAFLESVLTEDRTLVEACAVGGAEVRGAWVKAASLLVLGFMLRRRHGAVRRGSARRAA